MSMDDHKKAIDESQKDMERIITVYSDSTFPSGVVSIIVEYLYFNPDQWDVTMNKKYIRQTLSNHSRTTELWTANEQKMIDDDNVEEEVFRWGVYRFRPFQIWQVHQQQKVTLIWRIYYEALNDIDEFVTGCNLKIGMRNYDGHVSYSHGFNPCATWIEVDDISVIDTLDVIVDIISSSLSFSLSTTRTTLKVIAASKPTTEITTELTNKITWNDNRNDDERKGGNWGIIISSTRGNAKITFTSYQEWIYE